MRSIALALALLAAPAAQAACQAENEVFSCLVGTKTLQICNVDGALAYTFGRKGKPELTITEPLETIDYAPWSGFGSNRFYTVTFKNNGFAYEVWSDFDRIGDPRGIDGGVTVRNGGSTVAELSCDWGSVTRELEIIGNLKADLGQCYDQKRDSWRVGSCGRNPEFCAC